MWWQDGWMVARGRARYSELATQYSTWHTIKYSSSYISDNHAEIGQISVELHVLEKHMFFHCAAIGVVFSLVHRHWKSTKVHEANWISSEWNGAEALRTFHYDRSKDIDQFIQGKCEKSKSHNYAYSFDMSLQSPVAETYAPIRKHTGHHWNGRQCN